MNRNSLNQTCSKDALPDDPAFVPNELNKGTEEYNVQWYQQSARQKGLRLRHNPNRLLDDRTRKLTFGALERKGFTTYSLLPCFRLSGVSASNQDECKPHQLEQNLVNSFINRSPRRKEERSHDSSVDQRSTLKHSECGERHERWNIINSPSPYQPVGNGGTDTFDAFAISIDEFNEKLYPLLQQSYTYKSMEFTNPTSSIRWMQAQVEDAASMHGLYASSMAMAARLAPGDSSKRQLRNRALMHYNQTLAIVQRRIQSHERLTKLAYDTISLLVYTYNMGDWQSYRIHFNGMRNIVNLLGGIESIDPTLQLLLLVGGTQGSSHMLIKPIFGPESWHGHSWNEDPSVAPYSHLFEFEKSPQLILPFGGLMQSSLHRLLQSVQEFHSISMQIRLTGNSCGTYDTIRRWLNTRFFLLTMTIVNTYCDIAKAKILGDESQLIDLKALGQAFLVALLCCHQLLYYAHTNPAIISMHYIPFYHIKKHLADIKGLSRQPNSAYTPEIMELLMWISIVGAYEELSNDKSQLCTRTAGWNSQYCLQIISCQPMSIKRIHDVQTDLKKFLYDDSVLDPVLYRLWDLMLTERSDMGLPHRETLL